MRHPTRVVLYGIAIWLVVFGVSVLIYPLHDAQRPFFESIMPVTIALCVTPLAVDYLGRLDAGQAKAGLSVGGVWLLVNVVIDLPLFTLGGPMWMAPADYVMDIGFTYLLIPIIVGAMGIVAQRSVRHAQGA